MTSSDSLQTKLIPAACICDLIRSFIWSSTVTRACDHRSAQSHNSACTDCELYSFTNVYVQCRHLGLLNWGWWGCFNWEVWLEGLFKSKISIGNLEILTSNRTHQKNHVLSLWGANSPLSTSHLAANCPSTSWRGSPDGARETTWSAKSREVILRPPNSIPSTAPRNENLSFLLDRVSTSLTDLICAGKILQFACTVQTGLLPWNWLSSPALEPCSPSMATNWFESDCTTPASLSSAWSFSLFLSTTLLACRFDLCFSSCTCAMFCWPD